MTTKKIALVTGGNKGVGFEICKQLAQKDMLVILTARAISRGQAAVQKLRAEGIGVLFHQLDVTDIESIDTALNFIKKEFGRLDILVNNAGIFIDQQFTGLTVDPEMVIATYRTNVIGPLMLCQKCIPLMRENGYGRIVNISSELGLLHGMNTGQFPAYRMSKTGINALTRIMASLVKDDNIIINSMSPGWVKTDMGGQDAPGTADEGAKTAVWLATLDNDGPRGRFFSDFAERDW